MDVIIINRAWEKRAHFTAYRVSFHPETVFIGVILRSEATKNHIITGSAEILRFAQNEMGCFSGWKLVKCKLVIVRLPDLLQFEPEPSHLLS